MLNQISHPNIMQNKLK